MQIHRRDIREGAHQRSAAITSASHPGETPPSQRIETSPICTRTDPSGTEGEIRTGENLFDPSDFDCCRYFLLKYPAGIPSPSQNFVADNPDCSNFLNSACQVASLRRFAIASLRLHIDATLRQTRDREQYVDKSALTNNPLSYTDPDGYFFKKLFGNGVLRSLLSTAISIWLPGAGILIDAVGQWGAVFVSGFAAGVAANGSLRGGVMGAFSSGLFHSIGSAFAACKRCVGSALGSQLNAASLAAKSTLHGIAGGVMNVLQGGKFGHGFASASVTQLASGAIGRIDAGSGRSINRVAVAAVLGGTVSQVTGGKFANGAIVGAFSRAFNDEVEAAKHRRVSDEGRSRKQCVLNGGGCNFSVAENPDANGRAPWYEIGAMSPVGDYALTIQMSADAFGVDPKLVSSIMFVETTHGYYDMLLSPFGMNKSILPMNINVDFWGDAFGSREFLSDPRHNIWAGAKMLSYIQANMPGASIAQIATVYNNVNATRVSDYGARVSAVYSGN